MIDIGVINESTTISDEEIKKMMPALQTQWTGDLKRVWGVGDARFAFRRNPRKGMWWVVFLDNTDQADALAYHDVTNEGLPIAKVFVETLIANKASVSVGASHEICEMAVDPWINGAFQDPRGYFWASEVCDPVEGDRYGYKIGGILLSDFVTPDWFAYPHSAGALDVAGHVSKPFQILAEGYAQRFEGKRGWVQDNGRFSHLSVRADEDVPGTRRERRRRLMGAKAERSRVRFAH